MVQRAAPPQHARGGALGGHGSPLARRRAARGQAGVGVEQRATAGAVPVQAGPIGLPELHRRHTEQATWAHDLTIRCLHKVVLLQVGVWLRVWLHRQGLRDCLKLAVHGLLAAVTAFPGAHLPLVQHAGVVEPHALLKQPLEAQELACAHAVEARVAQLGRDERLGRRRAAAAATTHVGVALFQALLRLHTRQLPLVEAPVGPAQAAVQLVVQGQVAHLLVLYKVFVLRLKINRNISSVVLKKYRLLLNSIMSEIFLGLLSKDIFQMISTLQEVSILLSFSH